MRARCNNPKDKSYKYYGGRGISYCNDWEAFKGFEAWAISSGYEPGLQLDRADNNGNYAPSNCRWVTRSENMQNTRHNLKITAFGETKCLREWFRDERCVVASYNTLHSRIVNGWDHERALTE